MHAEQIHIRGNELQPLNIHCLPSSQDTALGCSITLNFADINYVIYFLGALHSVMLKVPLNLWNFNPTALRKAKNCILALLHSERPKLYTNPIALRKAKIVY